MRLTTKLSLLNTIATLLIVSGVLLVLYQYFSTNARRSIEAEFGDAGRFVAVLNSPLGRQYIVRRWDFYIFSTLDDSLLNDPYGIGRLDGYEFDKFVKLAGRYFYFKKHDFLVFGRDVSPIVNFLHTLRNLFLLAVIGLATGIFLSNYLVTARSVGDLKTFVEQIKQLGGKDLSFRVRIVPKSDEVSELVETFNELMGRIERTYKAQESFVSAVSHELRTPVSSLLGYVSMLKRWGLSDQRILEESVRAIEESGVEIKEIIENMLLIARVETLTSERIDLREFVEDLLQQKYRDRSVEVRGNGFMETNREGLGIITSIILNNAFTHGAPPFVVEISDSKLSIVNHGERIPEEEIPRIFEKFYKGRRSEGTGLGLYIAREISKKMGLEIHVESDDERTVFSIAKLRKDTKLSTA